MPVFCRNIDCRARTFAEQVPQVTERYVRRTPLLKAMLESIGLALAGRAGARLAAMLGVAGGRTTLLRLVRALPDAVLGWIPVLGVDDFSLRCGHHYGTVGCGSGGVLNRTLDGTGRSAPVWSAREARVSTVREGGE